MDNNLFETLNEELYDVYAGGILYELGYWVGRFAAEVVNLSKEIKFITCPTPGLPSF